mmetsp:Transcript_2600/g.10536  ORF Transcript_2600/g.10536 Transcript_2600/m.10536 type:complete len:264 (-) Transcript_2600:2649-3440(-)
MVTPSTLSSVTTKFTPGLPGVAWSTLTPPFTAAAFSGESASAANTPTSFKPHTLATYSEFSRSAPASSKINRTPRASRPAAAASFILNLTKGITIFMTFLKSACAASGLALTFSRMSLTGGNVPSAPYTSARIPRHTSCQPPNFSATKKSTRSQTLGGGGTAGFFLGGAVAFATPPRTVLTRSSRYLPAAATDGSGASPTGKPAFVTEPSLPRIAPQTCSQVCGVKGAMSRVDTSMNLATRSARMPASPSHWTLYASRADCKS